MYLISVALWFYLYCTISIINLFGKDSFLGDAVTTVFGRYFRETVIGSATRRPDDPLSQRRTERHRAAQRRVTADRRQGALQPPAEILDTHPRRETRLFLCIRKVSRTVALLKTFSRT